MQTETPWWFWIVMPIAVLAGLMFIGWVVEMFTGASSREYLERSKDRRETDGD